MKKKLLIITRWYLPATKSGGTVRSLVALVEGLKEEFDITIATSDRDLGATEPYEGVVFDQFINQDGVRIIYLSSLGIKSMERVVSLVQADRIYVNSFFDITTQSLMVLKMLRKVEAPILLAPRGELGRGALSIKATKKKVYLALYKLFNLSKGITFQATSPEDKEDIVRMFPNNKVVLIPNPKAEMKHSVVLPIKKSGILRMVFLSRIAPVKNLDYALQVLRDFKFEGQLFFDIYGPDEDKVYWQMCQSIIEKIPNHIEVNYRGFLEPEKIPETLSKYHLFFVPTKGENFGHAIVEAMQVGLIPLISDKTPWQELESHQAGYSLPLEDPALFAKAIVEVVDHDNEKFLEISNNVKSYIQKGVNNQKTLGIYRDFFNEA